jgi:uncharacterized membrane protein YdjX (TVP38/TMEM64 family)
VSHGDFAGLRVYIKHLGAGGLALLIGLMLMHALIYYPTELVTATAGFVYGWLPGLAIVIVGWLLLALLSYLLGRRLAGPLLRSLLGRRYRDFEPAIDRGGTPLLLGYRLVPIVPFSFTGYAAGAVGTNLWTFTWTSVVGFLPLTVAVTYLGSRAQSLSLSNPLVWAAVALLLGLIVAAHRLQRSRRVSPGVRRPWLAPRRPWPAARRPWAAPGGRGLWPGQTPIAAHERETEPGKSPVTGSKPCRTRAAGCAKGF